MTAPDTACEQVRRAVLAMPMAQTLKLSFRRIERGLVELELPLQEAWCFRHGQLQATAVFAAADFAAVAAAATLLPAGFVNATADATLKIVAPATGDHLLARGRVVQAARAAHRLRCRRVRRARRRRYALRHFAGHGAQHRLGCQALID